MPNCRTCTGAERRHIQPHSKCSRAWNMARSSHMPSSLITNDNCYSFDKRVITNYEIMMMMMMMIIIIIIRQICLCSHQECTGEDAVQSHETSALDGADWSTSRPGRFTSGKKSRYPLNKRLHWPHSRPGSYREEKYLPAGIRNKDHPANSKLLYRPGHTGSE